MLIESVVRLVGDTARDSPVVLLWATLTLVGVAYVVLTEVYRAKQRIPSFGGPLGWPIVGNIPQIQSNAAEQYRRWSEQYGPVFQIMLGNVPVIVVNSAKSAREIFGANSQALASRPEFYTFHKIVSSTAGTTIGTSPFSDSLKRRRKGAASALNKPSIATYIDHIDIETRDFLKEFLRYGAAGTKKVDPMPMIQRLSLSLALTLNWGVRMKSQDDELFAEITHVEEEVSKFRSTTGNLQDYIPILRYIPDVFGGGRRALAKDMRRRRDKYLKHLNDDLDQRLGRGWDGECIQANVIRDREAKLNSEELTSISLTMLSGGLDTLTTLVAWSMALLSERQDIQEKAVEEIRKVYSQDKPLCDAYDDQSIAYIVALVRELLRYYTVLRLCLPRATIRDIVYEGKKIPSGSIIFLNAWACNMDPVVWKDPTVFRPERWLEQPDAPMFTYGLGYRMCAGSLLANREMYTIYLRLLAAFKIEGAEGEGGSPLSSHPVLGQDDPTQLVTVPRRMKVRLVPRNEKALVQALEEAATS
ncbi:hypothetical protein DV735_g5315, partial [Chaetothyriales sp. CBS 134920]